MMRPRGYVPYHKPLYMKKRNMRDYHVISLDSLYAVADVTLVRHGGWGEWEPFCLLVTQPMIKSSGYTSIGLRSPKFCAYDAEPDGLKFDASELPSTLVPIRPNDMPPIGAKSIGSIIRAWKGTTDSSQIARVR